MKHTVYKLCQHCKIIEGAGGCCIYDLQRQKYYPIPGTMLLLFNKQSEIHCFNPAPSFNDITEQQVAAEYLQFLLRNELVVEMDADECSLFPDLDMSWDFPSHISNCLIDARDDLLWFTPAFIRQLDDLRCFYLQLRFFHDVPAARLYSLLADLAHAAIKLVDVMLPEGQEHDFYAEIAGLIRSSKKVRTVTIHSAAEDGIYDPGRSGCGVIISTRQSIRSAVHCGVVHPAYFSSNLSHFTESLAHNTCLNRKISIDVNGDIKNCPSMKESFGNINDTTLQEAMNKPGFKQYWNVTKDQIGTCKDCEFRHICTDCRAYLERPEDKYSKPLKCGYNPYTCEWEDWSTHPLKQAAIHHYSIPC